MSPKSKYINSSNNSEVLPSQFTQSKILSYHYNVLSSVQPRKLKRSLSKTCEIFSIQSHIQTHSIPSKNVKSSTPLSPGAMLLKAQQQLEDSEWDSTDKSVQN